MSEITSRPEIQAGDWCIAGTRIPARAIRSLADAGYSLPDIFGEYPTLTFRQISAAIAFEEPVSPPSIEPIEVTEAQFDAGALAIWREREKEFPAYTRRMTPDDLDCAGGSWARVVGYARACIIAALAARG